MLSDAEVYQRLGDAGFDRLVLAFYEGVRTDDLLSPMYPPDEWEAAQHRLRDFLIQRFGGPANYSAARGHPRLRMRHGPFSIGPAEAQRWLKLMATAMEQNGIEADVTEVLWPYFVNTAQHMMNRPGE
ncbi:MAG TPA: globin [Tepidisphaeraceae bacterium]|jgi:hemoglobin